MKLTDSPIKNGEQDALNRLEFAKSIARSIEKYDQKDCFCVGLEGEWGSGKSSLINMILAAINEEKVIKIQFQPWIFSGRQDLITQLFAVFENHLKVKDYGKECKDIGKKLRNYANLLAPVKLIPFAGPWASILEKILNGIGISISSLGNELEKDISAIKKELCDALNESDNIFLIVIDDIDRLQDSEICTIFQLVKSIADFPNTIYLLSYDKRIITEALKREYSGKNDSFLDKIVQMPISIPHADENDLRDVIKQKIHDVFDEDMQNELFETLIQHTEYFVSIRKINRYFNTLNFTYQSLEDKVDFNDFAKLTILYVFENSVYQELAVNKKLLTESSDEQSKSQFIANLKTYSSKINAEKIVEQLFPIRNFSPESKPFVYNENPERYKRIFEPEYFKTFFSFAIGNDVISDEEFKEILSLRGESLSKRLLQLNENKLINNFIKKLKFIQTEDTNICIEIILSFIKLGLKDENNYTWGSDARDIYDGIFFNIDNYCELMEKIYRLSNSLDLLVQALEAMPCKQDCQNVRVKAEKYVWKELKKKIINGTISNEQKFYNILHFFSEEFLKDHKTLITEFINEEIKTDERLPIFIEKITEKPRFFQNNIFAKYANQNINWSSIQRYDIKIDEIESRLSGV